jgi:ketosteroid isomerase-like protein
MSDVHVLAEIRERLNAAENAGDPEPICAVMADDVVLMAPSVPVQEGKARRRLPLFSVRCSRASSWNLNGG